MANVSESAHAEVGDAGATLAADVNAAAEALEQLKRSLQRQPAEAAHASAPAPDRKAAATPARPLFQVVSVHALPQTPAPTPPAGPLSKVGRASAHANIWSFLAGLALSAAAAALLYIYLPPVV